MRRFKSLNFLEFNVPHSIFVGIKLNNYLMNEEQFTKLV